MIIIGAGMAGLLAARMLTQHSPVVWERQSKLPNNHSAVLRFRTTVVGDVTGIPFRKVRMIKSVLPYKNDIASVLAYSFKNMRMYSTDRSVTDGTVVAERYIAPPDFISKLAEGVEFRFNKEAVFPRKNINPTISTIPMPALMEALDYPGRDSVTFDYSEGFNITATVKNCDAYASLLVPDPSLPFSRISLTGSELIIECPNRVVLSQSEAELFCEQACHLIGIELKNWKNEPQVVGVQAVRQKYFKVLPISDDARKAFMLWATTNHNIYSLGRYATWRPGLLLDDLVQDIRLINRWILSPHFYEIARSR